MLVFTLVIDCLSFFLFSFLNPQIPGGEGIAPTLTMASQGDEVTSSAFAFAHIDAVLVTGSLIHMKRVY